MIGQVDFCGEKISRLIVGGNTVSGTSHWSPELDREMEDYFTSDNVKKMLFRCEKYGITTLQMRADKHIMRLLREYRQEGGTMNWIAQTAPEMKSFDGNVAQINSYKPALIYHHGCVTDDLYQEGELDELQRRLAVIRRTGHPVGLCTHMPEVVEYSEEHHWDVDFYMCCVYNISKPERKKQSLLEGNENPLFVESDIPLMYRIIREVSKPCLAFKILGATRRCASQENVRNAFEEAYASIKPGDAVIVGMYPKYLDQVALDAQYASEAIQKAGKGEPR